MTHANVDNLLKSGFDCLVNGTSEFSDEYHVTRVHSGGDDPSMISGFPFYNKESGSVEFAPNKDLTATVPNGKIPVLVIEKVDTGNSPVQFAILKLVMERGNDSVELPHGTRIVLECENVQRVEDVIKRRVINVCGNQ